MYTYALSNGATEKYLIFIYVYFSFSLVINYLNKYKIVKSFAFYVFFLFKSFYIIFFAFFNSMLSSLQKNTNFFIKKL